MSRPKVGLVLGSGAARGLAHIGVIKALQKEQIPVDIVAGTSIGALVGAAYVTDGMENIEDFMLNIDWRVIASYCDFVLPKKGLMEGSRIRNLLKEMIHRHQFEDLELPFAAVATDLHTGEEVVFNKGSLIEAVRASISLPGIFEPVRLNDRFLVDGGLVNPVPVSIARDLGAERIIAVDLTDHVEQRSRTKKRMEKQQQKTSSFARFDSSESESEGKGELKNEDQARIREHWVFKNLEERYRRMEKQVKNKINALSTQADNREDQISPSLFDVMANTIGIMSHQIAKAQLKQQNPDILIRPQLGYVGLFDYDEAEAVIEAGYNETMENMDAIKKVVE